VSSSRGRFETLARKLKAAIESGELGRLLWVSANTFCTARTLITALAPGAGTWAQEEAAC